MKNMEMILRSIFTLIPLLDYIELHVDILIYFFMYIYFMYN